MSLIDRETLQEFQNDLTEHVFTLIDDIVDALAGDSGMVFGEVPMTRDERIMQMLLDARDGTLDMLLRIAPDATQKQIAQFARDARAAGLVR